MATPAAAGRGWKPLRRNTENRIGIVASAARIVGSRVAHGRSPNSDSVAAIDQ